jgi:hypothetical protein
MMIRASLDTPEADVRPGIGLDCSNHESTPVDCLAASMAQPLASG